MDRSKMISQLEDPSEVFDFLVIGGGATGIGIALDASTRGYRVALFEQSDFTKGTSSRSTKLVHGGVRYLAQGDISLVLEALRERGLLRSPFGKRSNLLNPLLSLVGRPVLYDRPDPI